MSGNLTVITTAVAAGKARSAVGAWALQLKDALENAWLITCMFMNEMTYEPEINVYTEFDAFLDGANDVDALNKARDRKDISRETYLKEYKRRKILSPEFDADEDAEDLLDEVPSDGADLENEDDQTGDVTT